MAKAALGSLLSLALAALAVVGGGASGQSFDQVSKRTGTGRITGRVLAADDGKPARRVTVYVMGRADGDPDHLRVTRQAETDADGRFTAIDLPAGEYAVVFDRIPGFVKPASYRALRLTDGQAADVTFRLARTGAIEGRILDHYGDPLLGATVQVIDRVNVAGYFAKGQRQQSATTNDRGEYRIFDLPAGDYYVVAAKPPSDHHHAPPPPPVGFVSTYFPGRVRPADAGVVTVRPGQDTTGVNFALARLGLATVTVNAIDSRGATLGREAHASLRRLDGLERLPSPEVGRHDGSAFVFRGVEPGDYSLIVTRGNPIVEGAYLKVSVDKANLALDVRTNSGARVTGRVIVDGRPAEGGPGLPNVGVYANKAPRTFGHSYAEEASVTLKGTDRFTLAGLRGPMRISGSVTFGAVMSIQHRGEDLAGRTIDFVGTETFDEVVVELTTRVGTLDLRVQRPGTGNESEPLIFLFPEERARWRRDARQAVATLHRQENASVAAEFLTQSLKLMPGRYRVVAIETSAVEDPADPALLERLTPLATIVTVTAGETATATIPVSGAPRPR